MTTSMASDVIRAPRTYTVQMRDDGGATHSATVEVTAGTEAAQDAEAQRLAEQAARDWARDGDWGNDGAVVTVWYTLEDDDSEWAEEYVEVEIEPDHSALIRAADGRPQRESCGDDPDDHAWTGDGEGGVSENPGVWSTGGTSMVIHTHCRRCGLHRTERTTGAQRNPDEHDTVSYRWLDQDEIDRHVRNGDMD